MWTSGKFFLVGTFDSILHAEGGPELLCLRVWGNWVSAHLFRNQAYSRVSWVLSVHHLCSQGFLGTKRHLYPLVIGITTAHPLPTSLKYWYLEIKSLFSDFAVLFSLLQESNVPWACLWSLLPYKGLAFKGRSSIQLQRKGAQPHPWHEELCPAIFTVGLT